MVGHDNANVCVPVVAHNPPPTRRIVQAFSFGKQIQNQNALKSSEKHPVSLLGQEIQCGSILCHPRLSSRFQRGLASCTNGCMDRFRLSTLKISR
mmetsp:Transcript_21651/g.47199  ORF Transcript_21651/g.47199 Transcript_21651/m.47199 type:complete len:95 (+) Transcript_21651:179-463(+)